MKYKRNEDLIDVEVMRLITQLQSNGSWREILERTSDLLDYMHSNNTAPIVFKDDYFKIKMKRFVGG